MSGRRISVLCLICALMIPARAGTASAAAKTVLFSPKQSRAVFLALLADETVDVIELTGGTYHLPYTIINIDRRRPILVRPAAGPAVVFSGSSIGTDPQFSFGLQGPAGNITMQGFTFDGYVLGQQGIIQTLNVHDLALNDMTVRNSRCNGTTSQPYHAWALYLSSSAAGHAVRFTADRWTVDGSGRRMSALQVYGGDHVTARDWLVVDVFYAVYASRERGPLTDFVLDNWAVAGAGSSDGNALYIENSSGSFGNMLLIASGRMTTVGTPQLTDRGGNFSSSAAGGEDGSLPGAWRRLRSGVILLP